MSDFKTYWKMQNADTFEKADLSQKDIATVRNTIERMHKKGAISSKIIKFLQTHVAKLGEQWQASRAYWTESKRIDTQKVAAISESIDINKFRVILSPDACEICKKKTDNGEKIFKSEDIQKGGYGHVPPFHPNCYCILVPKAD